MKLKHKLTGIVGTFVRRYKVTGRGDSTIIKLADGRKYYAPTEEFSEV